jgi:hypothetical protein
MREGVSHLLPAAQLHLAPQAPLPHLSRCGGRPPAPFSWKRKDAPNWAGEKAKGEGPNGDVCAEACE